MRHVIKWLKAQYSRSADQSKVVLDYHKTFEHNGAQVLEDLRRFCYVYDTTHVNGDSHASAINEGKRQAYLHIVHMLETTLEETQPPTQKDFTDDRDSERHAVADI